MRILILLIALVTCLCAEARETSRQIVLPLASGPPVIDGVIGDGEWRMGSRIDDFVDDPREASGWIMATSSHIYVAVRSQMPVEGGILAEVHLPVAKLAQDDSIEIWIDPAPEAVDGSRYQFLCNAKGYRWSRMHPRGSTDREESYEARWQTASSFEDGWWNCEIAIPVATISPRRMSGDGTWLIDIRRNWQRPRQQAAMGESRLRFVGTPIPVVSLLERGASHAGKLHRELQVLNTLDKEIHVLAALRVEREGMPDLVRESVLHIPPDESRSLDLREEDPTSRQWTLQAAVTSIDKQTTFFRHRTTWLHTGPFIWKTHVDPAHPIDFDFAYYPGANRLRVRASVRHLPAEARLTALRAEIRKRGSQEAIAEIVFDRIVGGSQEKGVDLPPLDGEYEIALIATGTNVPGEPRIKPFIRRRFPWEGKKYGVTDRVFPPFTPIVVDGKSVRTVLRQHDMNDFGLWNQAIVAAQNTRIEKPLLARPMRYVIRMNGRESELKAERLQFIQTDSHMARARCSFTAEGFAATAEITWEYDGMMRVDLTLTATAAPLEMLQLEIPLLNEAATHLHAIGDGSRNAVTMLVPGRQGSVWSSQEIPVRDLPPNFCSYVYLGTPARGLCWFAANDRGWSWNPVTPNVVLLRDEKESVLQVNLVNQPILIQQPRVITFGLQAAPVKPRLDAQAWRYMYQRQGYRAMSSATCWGGFTPLAGVYPPNRDLLVWQRLAQSNLEGALAPADIDAVVAHYAPLFAPFTELSWQGQSPFQLWEETVRRSLSGVRHDERMIYYYNRACHLLEEEFLTYQDEWGMSDWRTDWQAQGTEVNHDLKIVPNESFLDYHLHWYDRAFAVGRGQGVFWDNLFLAATTNTRQSMAYTLPDGSIRPSTGIWGLRELAKRTFQFMAERGMPPITMARVSSNNILPIHAFATITTDLDWKFGQGMMQERFTPAYHLMVTNGELAGAWPVAKGDEGTADSWLIPRSYTGALLVHDVYWGEGRAGYALLRPVVELLERPGAKVWRYWDDGPAAVTGGSDALLPIAWYRPGERALIGLTNYRREAVKMELAIHADMLGMKAAGYSARDYETMSRYRIVDAKLVVEIPAFETRLIEILPQ